MNDMKWTYKTYNVDGSVNTTTTYYLTYAANLTCQQGEALFNALTTAQKVAQSVTVEPVAGAGQVRRLRNCAPAGIDGPWVADTDDGPSLIDETSGGTGTDPLPTDGSAWTQGNPGDTDDQGNAVTYSNPVILTDN